MPRLPEPLARLIAAFSTLPGVGPKTALRYAYHVLSRHPAEAGQFAKALLELHANIKRCDACGLDSERNPCEFCSNSHRDQTTLCIVATSRDVHVIESSGVFKGRYHVLGNTLDALEGITPEQLNIPSLLRRIEREPITEIILAFNPDIPGEATSMYLARTLKPMGIRVSALARGLQTGSDIEYVDPLTLGDAIQGRREMK